MEDQIISLETAKLAKEKGFGKWNGSRDNSIYVVTKYFHIKPKGYNINDWSEDKVYNISGYDMNWTDNNQQIFTFAPTQSLLQRWLREVHKIHLVVQLGDGTRLYKTYEEAMEKGLKESFKLI
jgi:hypothetical protein